MWTPYMKSHLKISHININGLRGRRNSLLNYLDEHPSDIISVNETKMSKESHFSFPNYKIVRRDRDENGGGVAILVRDNLDFAILNWYDDLNTEAIVIRISGATGMAPIVTYYNPPKDRVNREIFLRAHRRSTRYIILCDLHAPHQEYGARTRFQSGEILLDCLDNTN